MLLPYLAAGAGVARKQYAANYNLYRAINASEFPRKEKEIEVKAELESIVHRPSCNLNYSSYKSRGCDCSKREKVRELQAKLRGLEAGQPIVDEPAVPYWTVPFWPLTLMSAFIKNEQRNNPLIV